MKRYLRLSIIRKLPLFVVLSVLLLTVAFVSASNIEFEGNNYYYTLSPASGTSDLIGTFFMIMTILPFFSMNYRYSLGKSDLYRQVAFKEKRIRYGEHLSSLIIVCIAYTIALCVQVATLAVRNYIIFKSPDFYLYYGWFIPMYFTCLVVGIGLYFISYLLVSRSNSFINSLLVFCLGYTFFNCINYVVIAYCTRNIGEASFFLEGPSVIGAISYVAQIFERFICYNDFLFGNGLEWYYAGSFYTCIIEFVLLAALGIVAFIVEKDPSSEWAGKPDSDKPYQEILFHAGFGTIGLIIGTIMSGSIFSTILSLLFYVSYAASYYTLYGLLRRNFKLKGYQFGILFGNVGLSIIAGFIYMATTSFEY